MDIVRGYSLIYYLCGECRMKSKKIVFVLSALTLLVTSIVLIGVRAQLEMYWKANYLDYAPSGMPDFDQRHWTNFGTWSHCGPVAVANSLWWYDSAYEINTTPPPTIIDNFNLVTSYNPGGWDDHDPLNVQPFVEHLAHLMDTDGRRTGLLHLGTNVTDMETGVAQYLSWSGVNPQGDVDGNGIVDATDSTIVNTAMGSSPGTPGWNMAADIWPATTGWPVQGVADNIIDGNDLNLVTTNLNKTGMFYEHTVPTPDFHLIEEEVEKCQDVVLILGFYTEIGGEYFREDYPYPYGHAVTVAGVNSTTMQIAISDPVIDAFEMGLASGRSPVLHMHMPPEPPYITHNNASLVSHDVYNVTFDVVTGMWELKGYAGLPTPALHVLIESAVITSSDTIPPNIGNVSQDPPEDNVLPTDEVKVNATVTDDLSGVKQVILNYTNGNGTWITVGMANLQGSIWNATIPAFPFSTNVTYVIMAEDNANNTITTEEVFGYEYEYNVIPEFPSFLILPLFIIATLLAVTVYRRKQF
jgi:hypothetical protein